MVKCYLLGAGASHGYDEGLSWDEKPPLTKYVFPAAKRGNILDHPHYSDLYNWIKEDLGISGGNILPDDLKCDSEAVLKRLEEKYLSTDSKKDSVRYQTALTMAHYLLFELFRRYSSEYSDSDDNYSKLVNVMEPQNDFVVSLNYDVLLEQAANTQGQDFHYLAKKTTGFPLLKLHGSINWINQMRGIQAVQGDFPERVRHLHTNTFGSDLSTTKFLKINELENFSYESLLVDTVAYEPILVPPLEMHKNYRKSPIYNLTWKYAAHKMKNVDELFIIGSSISENDNQLINLLCNKLPSGVEVSIYSGSQSADVKERLETGLDTNLFNPFNAYFGDFIEDHY